ncbi:MAG: M23 family metallopeptidase, partial [Nanoarchaeota archaeon]
MAQQRNKFDDAELSDLLSSSLTPVEERILHTTAAALPSIAFAIGVHTLYPQATYPLLTTFGASIVVSTVLYTTASRVHSFIPDQDGEPLSDRLIRYGVHALAAVPVLAASTTAFTLLAPYVSEPVDPVTLLFTQLSSYAFANTVVSRFIADDRKKLLFSSFSGLGVAALLYAYTSVSSFGLSETTYTSNVDHSETVEEKPTVEYTPKPIFTTWPSDAEKKRVNSCFAERGKTLGGLGTEIHGGIDIHAPWHTEIYSVGAGEVVTLDPHDGGRVVVDHGDGISTEYIHLDEITVKDGDDVKAGDVLGLAGCRGNGNRVEYCKYSIGHKNAHLHFNVIDTNISPHLRDINGDRTVLEKDNVNPLCYLDEAIGFVVASRSGCDTQGGAYKYCGDYLTAPQLLIDIQQKFGEAIDREVLRLLTEQDWNKTVA